MALSTDWHDSFCDGYDHARRLAQARLQRTLGGAVLVCVALVCAWIFWSDVRGEGLDRWAAASHQPAVASHAYAKLSAALQSYARRSLAAKSAAVSLFDSRFSLGLTPGTFTRTAALQADEAPAAAPSEPSVVRNTQPVSATPPRGGQAALRASAPSRLRLPPIRNAAVHDVAPASMAAADAPAEKPTIFQRLFGKLSTLTLAYATPDDGGLGGQGIMPGRYDRSTAVYDISAHTVYMPDGSRLEAHSGLGDRLDDPRHADERNRGVTPPNMYDLEPRGALFHGVRALRLIPVDDEKVFHRSGLLAHSYMLGPNGDSNGCVSFKNYDAFLQAYTSHQITRLAVVSRLE